MNTKVLFPYSSESLANATLHISKGNSKIGKGIYSFSTLPGDTSHLIGLSGNRIATNIPGTCSNNCDTCFDKGCYAVKSARQYHGTVIPAWAENTLLLRAGVAFALIDAFLCAKNRKYMKTHKMSDAVVKVFRINVSGEVQSVEEFEEWNALALKHPETRFAVYTKNYSALEGFLGKHGGSADNFVINCSQWHGVADNFLAKYRGKVNVFTYDDSNKKGGGGSGSTDHLPHCPAVLKNGRHAKDSAGNPITCDKCQRCYRKTGEETMVWAH